jgi:hypothetical protein
MLLLLGRRDPLNRIFIGSKLGEINIPTLCEIGTFLFWTLISINKHPNIVIELLSPHLRTHVSGTVASQLSSCSHSSLLLDFLVVNL